MVRTLVPDEVAPWRFLKVITRNRRFSRLLRQGYGGCILDLIPGSSWGLRQANTCTKPDTVPHSERSPWLNFLVRTCHHAVTHVCEQCECDDWCTDDSLSLVYTISPSQGSICVHQKMGKRTRACKQDICQAIQIVPSVCHSMSQNWTNTAFKCVFRPEYKQKYMWNTKLIRIRSKEHLEGSNILIGEISDDINDIPPWEHSSSTVNLTLHSSSKSDTHNSE